MKYLFTFFLLVVAGCGGVNLSYSKEIQSINGLPDWEHVGFTDYYTYQGFVWDCHGPVFNNSNNHAKLLIEIQDEIIRHPKLFEAHSLGFIESFTKFCGKLVDSEIVIYSTPLYSKFQLQNDEGYVVAGYIQTEIKRYYYILISPKQDIFKPDVMDNIINALNRNLE